MHKIIPLALLFLFATASVIAGNEPDYKHHTFELSVAAGLDHQFIVRRYKDPVMAQLWKDSERPFAGFCFGLSYTYRPIRMFGISTGLESLEYGDRIGKTEVFSYNNGSYTNTATYKGYGFDGSIGVPFFVHFYRQINRITVEFVTGPEFFFNVYSIRKYQVAGQDTFIGPVNYDINTTQHFSCSQIRESASLAWSVQLMASIPVTNAFSVSIGPEWKFLDIKQLGTQYPIDYAVPRTVPFFLGLKVGFRLGSNFYKKPLKA